MNNIIIYNIILEKVEHLAYNHLHYKSAICVQETCLYLNSYIFMSLCSSAHIFCMRFQKQSSYYMINDYSLLQKQKRGRKKGIAASKAPVIREFSLWGHGACTDVFPAVKVDLICFYYADAFKRIRERMGWPSLLSLKKTY